VQRSVWRAKDIELSFSPSGQSSWRAYVLALIKTPILVIQHIWRNFPKSFLDKTSHPPLRPLSSPPSPYALAQTWGIFYMEYIYSFQKVWGIEQRGQWLGIGLETTMIRWTRALVEKDSFISVFVYFWSCSFSLYNRTFAFWVFPLRRSSINGKREHHRKV
jgi:hypothetical protein